MTKHIYLSPHLDDAVLSCGGAIHRHTAAGEPVLVLTFFAGEASAHGATGALSSFALLQHHYWGDPPCPMALRRAEDVAALSLLQADWYHAGYLDAVYRADASGRWLYTDLETLLGQVQPGDPMVLAQTDLIAQVLGFARHAVDPVIYAPLAVGRHVDHQIVHAAARQLASRGCRVAFYEDYPYADQPGASEAALTASGAKDWRLEVIHLSPADVAAQVSAVDYYRSQLGILFRGAEAMPSRVWGFAASRSLEAGLAERIWWPPEG
ncbi:MAG: PIG-L family deacetylase [Anaerolineae bacterium]|nr:PIG-L family deacetylase [Anaerolineae bacterium]